MDDFVSQLGVAFLAHRLRRMSDTIVESTTHVLRSNGFLGPARSVSMIMFLRDSGPVGVMELAEHLKLSHPMVIRLADALQSDGIIDNEIDPRDSRRRLLKLTPIGINEAAIAERISAAIATALQGPGEKLLEALEHFSLELEARPLATRIAQAIDRPANKEGDPS